jgi:hypothetical protein
MAWKKAPGAFCCGFLISIWRIKKAATIQHRSGHWQIGELGNWRINQLILQNTYGSKE